MIWWDLWIQLCLPAQLRNRKVHKPMSWVTHLQITVSYCITPLSVNTAALLRRVYVMLPIQVKVWLIVKPFLCNSYMKQLAFPSNPQEEASESSSIHGEMSQHSISNPSGARWKKAVELLGLILPPLPRTPTHAFLFGPCQQTSRDDDSRSGLSPFRGRRDKESIKGENVFQQQRMGEKR